MALVTIDPLVEDCPFWVKHIKDSICVHLLAGRIDTYLEVRKCLLQQLCKVWPLEDSDLNHIALVLETSVEVWLGPSSVDLVDLDVHSCRSMDQSLIHIEK